MKLIVGVAFAIAQVVIQNAVKVYEKIIKKWKDGEDCVKKFLKKRILNQERKVLLCSGIAPIAATYEADCWGGVCYSSGCYSIGC